MWVSLSIFLLSSICLLECHKDVCRQIWSCDYNYKNFTYFYRQTRKIHRITQYPSSVYCNLIDWYKNYFYTLPYHCLFILLKTKNARSSLFSNGKLMKPLQPLHWTYLADYSQLLLYPNSPYNQLVVPRLNPSPLLPRFYFPLV